MIKSDSDHHPKGLVKNTWKAYGSFLGLKEREREREKTFSLN